jgi:antitoxin (DNA-binding transcriptional repressor) of toxin-antitoxin stability system
MKVCEYDYMRTHISATEAVRSFSELMNRIRYRGESFVVERGGKPICEILPATPAKFTGSELASLLRSLPRPDKEYFAVLDDLMAKQPPVAEARWPR